MKTLIMKELIQIFTLNISMKLLLQLFLILIFWNHAAIQVDGAECVNFKNIDLRIPDDSLIVMGEDTKSNDTWYQHVRWTDTYAGDLTLNASVEYKGSEGWQKMKYSGIVTPLLENENREWNGFRKLLKKALGLNEFFRIPNKLRVPHNLFANERCLEFPVLSKRNEKYQYRIPVEVVDEEENKILTGHLLHTVKNVPISD